MRNLLFPFAICVSSTARHSACLWFMNQQQQHFCHPIIQNNLGQINSFPSHFAQLIDISLQSEIRCIESFFTFIFTWTGQIWSAKRPITTGSIEYFQTFASIFTGYSASSKCMKIFADVEYKYCRSLAWFTIFKTVTCPERHALIKIVKSRLKLIEISKSKNWTGDSGMVAFHAKNCKKHFNDNA